MIIYLAGDMKSGWQDYVKGLLPNDTFIDPRHQSKPDNPQFYTEWDLAGVTSADLVIAYMHPGNPSGYGLCIEAGYAAAKGKLIIFADCCGSDWRGRYFDMLRHISTVTKSLAEAAAVVEAVRGNLDG